jgi:hypothetical protein
MRLPGLCKHSGTNNPDFRSNDVACLYEPSGFLVVRRIKLSLALPRAQVIVTAILTLWADSVDWMRLGGGTRAPGPYVRVHLMASDARYIWSGINAPTFPLCFASGAKLPAIGIAGVGEVLYLLAVAFLWFRVGLYFDNRRGLEAGAIPTTKWHKTIFRILAMCWGMVLLLWNASTLNNAFPVLFLGGRFFPLDVVIVRTLFLLWSVILIAFPALQFARGLHRKSSI